MDSANTILWTERKTTLVVFEELPFEQDDNVEILDYSMVRISVPWKVNPIDIGAFCYSRRKIKNPSAKHPGNHSFVVDTTSLKKERTLAINRLLEYLFTKSRIGTRPSTIQNHIAHILKYIDWCDSNGYESVLVSPLTARAAYIQYSYYLTEMTRTNTLSVNSAARYQIDVKDILNAIFDDDCNTISAGVRQIRRSTAVSQPIAPPPQEKVRCAVDLYLALFSGLTDFILNDKKYPFSLKLPNEAVWVFPSSRPMAVKDNLLQRDGWSRGYWALDYEHGTYSDPKLIEKYYSGDKQQKRDSVRIVFGDAMKKLREANTDSRDFCRRRLACLASDSFIMLFISNTAMNLALVCDLSWHEDYEISKEHQGYKTIKYRANRKSQEFVITSSFLSQFKKYLELRSYLLNGVDAPLFFGMDNKIVCHRPLNDGFSQSFNNRLNNYIGMNAPNITAREWRAYKADWLMRSTDLHTTARVLQNSERTVLNHYIEGSESESAGEMAKFYKMLNESITQRDSKNISNYTNVPSGHCSQYEDPKSIKANLIVPPDCTTPIGCLFCANHRVVADDTDIHKLTSLKYIVVEMKSLAANEAHYQKVYGPALDRIDELLKAIGDIDAESQGRVDHIRNEVFLEERLDPYWALKYKLLINLEILR